METTDKNKFDTMVVDALTFAKMKDMDKLEMHMLSRLGYDVYIIVEKEKERE